jgi:hypothetical protein
MDMLGRRSLGVGIDLYTLIVDSVENNPALAEAVESNLVPALEHVREALAKAREKKARGRAVLHVINPAPDEPRDGAPT